MKKRILAILLTLALLLGLPAPVRAAQSSVEPVDVLVTVYSNQTGTEKLRGLYQDNVFYLDAEQICALSGAEVTQLTSTTATFSLHGGARYMTVTDNGKVTEIQGKQKLVQSLPARSRLGKLYISAVDILRYMGATVGFGLDETADVHMWVTMPYTVLDLVQEYYDNRGYAFSWAEAAGKWVDPEDVLELAALDTILLGYDSNVLAYALPGYAEHVENTMYQDVLLEILRTEPDARVHYEDPAVEILGFLDDYSEVSFSWIQDTMEWAADTDAQKKLSSVLGDYIDEAGVLVDMSAGCISSLEAVKQFTNLTAAQKNLMANTFCRVHPATDLYQQHPMMFRAAVEAHSVMTGEYSANEKAKKDAFYNALSNIVDAVTPPNPVTTAWDYMTGIVKLNPIFADLLADERGITFASECSDVRVLTDRLLATDGQKLEQNNYYLGKKDTAVQVQLKHDIILSLKASLCARQFLLDTGWLTEEAQAAMEQKANLTAALLNKAQNARDIALGVYKENKEDISWIEKLVCSGGYGNVVRAGGYTYFWRYTTDSFGTEGYTGFGHTNVHNSFVRQGPDGKTEELLYLNGHGQFAVASGYVFYQTTENLIRSERLEGGDKQEWGDGFLCDATEDGQYVFFEGYQGSYDETSLYRIDVASGTKTKLVSMWQYVTYHDGRIYYTKMVDQEEAQMGKVSLWSIRVDGTENTHLYTTKADLYGHPFGYSNAMVDQIRFTDKYIYFSYGSLGGSGAIYQGGKIARVGYDGTGGCVVAGDEELVDGYFTVTERDELTSFECGFSVQHQYGESYRTGEGNLYAIDQNTGFPMLVVSYGDYDVVGDAMVGVYGDSGIVLVDFVEVVDGKVYYLLYSAVEENTVWWASRVRKKTAMMEKDLTTGQVRVLFQF